VSGQEFVQHKSVDVGQSAVDADVAAGQLLEIDAEDV
jgi:hypothetical protein